MRGSVRVRVRVRVAAGLTEPTWLSPWLQSAEDRTYVHAHVMCVGPCRPLEVPPPWRGEAPPPAAAGTTAGCFEKGVGWTDFFSAVGVVERKKHPYLVFSGLYVSRVTEPPLPRKVRLAPPIRVAPTKDKHNSPRKK